MCFTQRERYTGIGLDEFVQVRVCTSFDECVLRPEKYTPNCIIKLR